MQPHALERTALRNPRGWVRVGRVSRHGPLGSAAVIAERIESFTVDGPLLTDVGGTIADRVLSTPSMIGKMERCAAVLALEHLPRDRATVGFEVCIRHVASASEGARCTVRAALREIVDERKLRFDVEVREGERVIGIGTHERRAVPRAGGR
jgi:fluoroacetyl-CoA thioesterase